LTNSEELEQVYRECGKLIGESAMLLKQAYQHLDIGNMVIQDCKTFERARDVKIRHADLECMAKQFMATRFFETPTKCKKTSQCYNCEGSGKVMVGNDKVTCPVCDGSGNLQT
jgi:DnaJ-class molecular chaperone